MKKRIVCLLVTAAAFCFAAAGCGDNTQSDGAGAGTAEEESQTEESGEEEKEIPFVEVELNIPEKTPYAAELPTAAVESSIYVEPVEGISDDFIRGVDVSSVLVEEASGVVYYNEAGEEADLFQVLADAGVNYIRVRVWNDPYDENGRGYGGGNNDVEKAAIIGSRAADYGMKLLVDFHYSDFWADPSKQMCPKAWKDMSFSEKEDALYRFTKESLATILNAGADVGIVQVGNETTRGMSGETNFDKIIALMADGSRAIREISEQSGKDIKVATHFTNIEDKASIDGLAERLDKASLDYDIFGVSYYGYWHGDMDNLTDTLKRVHDKYGKATMVMETAYPYTSEDGDDSGNSVYGEGDIMADYLANVQDQATFLRDVMQATVAAGDSALGICYWEGAWIPVPGGQKAKTWEEFGSGWASRFAAGYDPKDAGQYYGGCSWDNQALFDFSGHPLASLNVFKYVKYGATCDIAVEFVRDASVDVNIGDTLVMPEAVEVVYNKRSNSGPEPVQWDAAQVDAIDTSNGGEYIVNGTLEDGTETVCKVTVKNVNYLLNPGFEEKDMSMWDVSYEGSNPTDVQEKSADAYTGDFAFHFWDSKAQSFKVEQTVKGLAAGSYTANVNIQGGDVGNDAEIYLYVVVGDKVYESDRVKLDGWVNWKTPEISGIELDGAADITVGVSVKCAANGWGTMDDFMLYK